MTLRQRLITLNLSILLSLLILEIGLRVFLPAPLEGNITFDTPKAAQYGWAMPPDSRLAFINPDNGQISPFMTNSEGWNDVQHTWEKPTGTIRILFIGDSNTAMATPRESLYTRQVEKLLHEAGFPQVEVISLAADWWATDQALEALHLEGLLYSPDLVIHQFDQNDLEGLLWQTIGDSVKPFHYQLEAGQLIRQDTSEQWQTFTEKQTSNPFREHSHLLRYLNRLGQSIYAILDNKLETPYPFLKIDPTSPYYMFSADELPPEVEQVWQLWEALVLEMNRLSYESDATFMVFTQEGEDGKLEAWQTWNTIQNNQIIWEGESYSFDFTRPNQEINKRLESYGIPLIFPQQIYSRYDYDIHANPEGNLRMAEDIVAFLLEWEGWDALIAP